MFYSIQKLLGALLLICTASLALAQAPPTSLEGAALRSWLKTNYYDGQHSTLGYTAARRYLYNFIDNKSNKLTCVYSGYQMTWAYGGTGTNPSPINCEHTVPQSLFGSVEPMKSDLHHLFPTYQNWNSTRSNYPFADIADATTEKWMVNTTSQTAIPSSNINAYSEYANQRFEPREDHKGNLARAVFYFYTMYPTQGGSITGVADLATLYQWHLADPVDATEIQRNNLIESYQGDRNPYVDYPDAVARAWGFAAPAPTLPAAPGSVQALASASSVAVSWADVANETGYRVFKSANGGAFAQAASLGANAVSYTDNAVTAGGTYRYYIVAYNANGNSPNSATATATVPQSGGALSELIISEYVEGSSNNKALEIANFTGASVSLSAYALAKQTNGAGSWVTLPLSGSLANGATYVVVYSSASTTLKAKGNLSTSSSVMTFNGNDPVALMKNGTVIDAVGTYNSTAVFGQDVTLRRNASVTGPRASYLASEWTNAGIDNFGGLGTHAVSGSAPAPAPVSYCASKGNSTADEWIASVRFANLNHTSGNNGGYADRTSQTASVVAGGSYTLAITPAWAGTAYSEAYDVWIDYNQDGTFDDANELVFTRSRTTATSVSGTVTVPATAKSGTTRMRVAMKYNANAQPCETFSYGEVEDYTVSISGGARMASGAQPEKVVREELPLAVSAFPNPAVDVLRISAEVPSGVPVLVRLVGLDGRVAHERTYTDADRVLDLELSVAELPRGLYVVQVAAGEARGLFKIVLR